MDEYNYNKTKKISSKQKKSSRVLNNEHNDIREIIFSMEVSNISNLNIYQVLTSMFKIKTKTAPPNSGRSNISIQLDLILTVFLKIN